MRFRRRTGPYRDLPVPEPEVQASPASVGERPPERASVKARLRDSTFDPPGRSVIFDCISADRVRFESPELFEFLVYECEFADCSFTGKLAETGTFGSFGDWHDSRRFNRSLFRACSFVRCDVSSIEPGWTRFEDCTFTDCKIKGWFTHNAEFVSCSFPNTSLEDTSFFGTTTYRATASDPPLRPNEFLGNDFSRAGLAGTSFRRGIDLQSQVWPEGSEILSNLHARIEYARAQIGLWKEGKRRERGLFRLEMLQNFYAGQVDLLVDEQYIEPEICTLLRGPPI